jgi:hypothetical protein
MDMIYYIIGALYYIFGLLMMIKLIHTINDLEKISNTKEWIFKFNHFFGKKPIDKDFPDKKELSTYNAHVVLNSFEWLWVLCGLFSGNYIIFLAILILGSLKKIVDMNISFGKIFKTLTIIFVIIRGSLYFLMIYNHFFLHINLLKLIL